MKKKKRNFDARFWSGTKKHSVPGLLEAFFQFNDLAIVKEALSAMMQCSVEKNARIKDYPSEVFHLHQSLRSLVRAGRVIGEKAGEWTLHPPAESHAPAPGMGLLSEEEYREPLRVFRKAFKACRAGEFDDFLASVVYFSLGDAAVGEEQRLIRPYLHLAKMLDAAYLIVQRGMKRKEDAS
jgi:hypothetical protein